MLLELALGLPAAFLRPIFLAGGLMGVFALVFSVAAFLASKSFVTFYTDCQIRVNRYH